MTRGEYARRLRERVAVIRALRRELARVEGES
jgi:hypothetical protein